MGLILESLDWVTKTFRDGGLVGWFAVLVLFSSWMVWVGLIKCLAVMLPTLQEQFNASTWLVGWMIAIIDASIDFSAIFASPLREIFGARAVVTVSGILVGGSLIASSFASSLYQIAIILTLFAGPALGVSSIVSREVIGQHFGGSIALAFSMGGLGGSLTYVTIAPLTQYFLDVFGWRGTMMLLGGIFSHLAVCGALMKEPAATRSNHDYHPVTVDEEPRVTSEEEPTSISRCRSCLNSFVSPCKSSLFSSVPFWIVLFMMNIWMMMYTAWIIYFVPNTVSKGFSMTEVSSFIVSYGIGRILTGITLGRLIQQFTVISNSAWLGIGLFSSSIYYLVDPWLVSFWPVFVTMFIYGYATIIPLVQFDIVIIEIFGADQLGTVLGLVGLIAGFCRILSLYFPGLIYDVFGSYTLAFTLIGGVHFLSVLALLLLVWLQRRRPSIL